jgi:hypothetical protein
MMGTLVGAAMTVISEVTDFAMSDFGESRTKPMKKPAGFLPNRLILFGAP